MADESSSGLKSPEPTCMSDIWTIFIPQSSTDPRCAPGTHYALQRTVEQDGVSGCCYYCSSSMASRSSWSVITAPSEIAVPAGILSDGSSPSSTAGPTIMTSYPMSTLFPTTTRNTTASSTTVTLSSISQRH